MKKLMKMLSIMMFAGLFATSIFALWMWRWRRCLRHTRLSNDPGGKHSSETGVAVIGGSGCFE